MYKTIIISSSIFGIIIPIISGIIPLRKALSATLQNSLNIYYNTIDQIFIKIINNNKYDINIIHFLIGILLIIIGIICLYIIPYCIVNENYYLFFTIFDCIFLG